MKWYQDKVRETLTEHAELETKEGRAIDYSIRKEQAAFEAADPLCQMMGPEIQW